jgi:hypothetical protein
VSCQLHAPAALSLWELAYGTHWIWGWVGASTGLSDAEGRKILALPGLKLRPLGRPVRSHDEQAVYPAESVEAAADPSTTK